jgi:hypothetical protein
MLILATWTGAVEGTGAFENLIGFSLLILVVVGFFGALVSTTVMPAFYPDWTESTHVLRSIGRVLGAVLVGALCGAVAAAVLGSFTGWTPPCNTSCAD